MPSTRPALCLAIVAAVGFLGAAPAGADSGGAGLTDSGLTIPGLTGRGLTGSGDPDSGSISATIEKFGQSLCPSLVKPGSELATKLSEMQGNSGLTPALTGMVTGLAIQLECPAFMKRVANGDVSLEEVTEASSAVQALLGPSRR